MTIKMDAEERLILTNELLPKAKAGDQDAKNQIFVVNEGLIHHISKKFANTSVSYEDLVGIASLGMVKAYNAFDPGREIKFSTFASRCMTNEILVYLRKIKNEMKNVSLDSVLFSDEDGKPLTVRDVVADPLSIPGIDEYPLNDQELFTVCKSFINGLSERDKAVFLRKVMAGGTQKEVGELLGISQSYVCRLSKGLIKKLRAYAMRSGFIDRALDYWDANPENKPIKPPKEGADRLKIDVGKLKYLLEKFPEVSPAVLAKAFKCSITGIKTSLVKIGDGRYPDRPIIEDEALAADVVFYMTNMANPRHIRKGTPKEETFPKAEVTKIGESKIEVETEPEEIPFAPTEEGTIEIPILTVSLRNRSRESLLEVVAFIKKALNDDNRNYIFISEDGGNVSTCMRGTKESVSGQIDRYLSAIPDPRNLLLVITYSNEPRHYGHYN